LGYGFPKEVRPRKEKVAAIAKQVFHFLWWQQQHQQHTNKGGCALSSSSSSVVLAMRPQDKEIKTLLSQRIRQLWQQQQEQANDGGRMAFPHDDALRFHMGSLESLLASLLASPFPSTQQDIAASATALYLSPDADRILSNDDIVSSATTTTTTTTTAPRALIVGGIIDRKHVQHGRSMARYETLGIPAVRWPLPSNDNWDPHEPLNIDCVLQGLQLFLWTGDLETSIATALRYHTQRHPGRPQHKTTTR